MDSSAQALIIHSIKPMKQETLFFGGVGLLIGVVITALVGYVFNQNQAGMMGMGENRGGGETRGMVGGIDRHFIEQMIPHHEDAIVMADLALVKANRQEIKDLARDIKKTQSAEISEMRAWYTNWFGQEVSQNGMMMGGRGAGGGMMQMGTMGNETDMEKLQNASDFDRAFIESMIPHHQMAVMMANMLLASTDRPEMKNLAEDIIVAQTKEINQMREWAKAWGMAGSE